MKPVPRKPAVPRAAQETVRRAIIDILRGRALSAKDISAEVRIAEKEVYGHLDHIRLSIHSSGALLEIIPAECRACGFVFTKRDRLTPPGRFPVCRNESIVEPLFAIRRLHERET